MTLVAGPSSRTPEGVTSIDVDTAREWRRGRGVAPAETIGGVVAAVADWRVEAAPAKLKKSEGPPALAWSPNPDILADLARSRSRPRLLVGFAAETQDVEAIAGAKREAKGCDWIVANDVSGDVMGGDMNAVHLIGPAGIERWARASKAEVARRLAERIAAEIGGKE